MNRKHFISTVAGATASSIVGVNAAGAKTISSLSEDAAAGLSGQQAAHKVKRGVALYSYQQTMGLNRMTLEEMLQEAASIGAYGIEAIGQVFIEGYPNPPESFFDKWWELHDKYGTKPVSYTNFHDLMRQRKPMNLAENLEYQIREFKLARAMGLTKIRMLNGTPSDLLVAAIPYAEKYGVWMGVEIHSPTSLDSPWVAWILEQAVKYPEAIGLYPDMGIFTKYPRPYARERQIKAGTLTRDIALYIEDSYKKGVAKEEVASKVKGMKPKEGDTKYIETVYRSANAYQDVNKLATMFPYCKAIHGKFWEMEKGNVYNDTQITYDSVVPVLMAKGYDGYILSEYEGQRSMDVADVNELDEVRRQHLMLKRLMGV
jgi:hypothetical protein